jgi:Tfp pilus assembly protein PilX
MGIHMTKIKNIFGKAEQGVALIATLMFLLAMGILSTALVFTLNNEMRTSASYKHGEQAFYVANAGVQEAVQWFRDSYTPWVPATAYDATTIPVRYGGNPVTLTGQNGTSVFPGGTAASSFTSQFHNTVLQANSSNSGKYAVNATLLKYTPANFIDPTTFVSHNSAIERWRLNSTGYWGSDINNPIGTAQITAVIENSGNALFDRALWGIDSLDLGGTVLVDSYDPKLGPYGGTNIGSEGSVGSNGSVSVNGTGVEIKGDVAYGPTGTYTHSGTPTVTGSIIHLAEPRFFPPIPPFSVGATDLNPKNGTITINPGSYRDITIGAKGVLALNPGVYYFDSISEAATGSLQINGTLNDTTTIFVRTSLDLSGQGVVNLNGDPTRLTINYSGTNESKVAGGSSAFVEMYAPNAPLKLVGTSNFYGSFIGKTVQVQGTPDVHFDEGCLDKNLLQRQFRLITWSKDTF